jgi:hypothetical protein
MTMSPEFAKSRSGPTIVQLKEMAKYLHLSCSHAKEKLVDMIRTHEENKKQLDIIEGSRHRTEATSFKKDKNTIPRICNLLRDESEDLIRLQMLPSREQLQLGHVSHNQPVYTTIAEKFNDWNTMTGGLIDSMDDILLNHEINPDRKNRSGEISPLKVFELFNECRKKYATACSKFYQATGVHDEKHFINYCGNDVDVYYMFLTMKSFKSESLDSFCREGYEISAGFDSVRPSLTTLSYSPCHLETKSQSRAKASMAATTSIAKSFEKSVEDDKDVNRILSQKHLVSSLTALSKEMRDIEDKIDELEVKHDYYRHPSPIRILIVFYIGLGAWQSLISI